MWVLLYQNSNDICQQSRLFLLDKHMLFTGLAVYVCLSVLLGAHLCLYYAGIKKLEPLGALFEYSVVDS